VLSSWACVCALLAHHLVGDIGGGPRRIDSLTSVMYTEAGGSRAIAYPTPLAANDRELNCSTQTIIERRQWISVDFEIGSIGISGNSLFVNESIGE
jgi:hypothetical protein